MPAALKPPPGRVTAAEFLDWPDDPYGAEVFRRQQDGGWPELSDKTSALDGLVRLESIDAACALAEFYRGTDLA